MMTGEEQEKPLMKQMYMEMELLFIVSTMSISLRLTKKPLSKDMFNCSKIHQWLFGLVLTISSLKQMRKIQKELETLLFLHLSGQKIKKAPKA